MTYAPLPDTEDEVDHKREDAAIRPKRKLKRKAGPMPGNLVPYTAKAKARLEKMPASPGVMVKALADKRIRFTSPHEDLEAWEIQISAAFGTRSQSAVRTFIRQLAALCRTQWDDDGERWTPSETELNSMVAIISDTRPRNSVQAALAAQMVAVHLMQMRLSAQALGNGYMDHRDASIAGKLARTYAMQMDALSRAQGRRSQSVKQTITVRKETHQHVHYHDDRGAGRMVGQSHDTGAGVTRECAALPCPEQGGKVVRLGGRKGP